MIDAPPSHRDIALLRAVAAGRVTTTPSSEPDLFVDGIACRDQVAATRLARIGLVEPAGPAALGHRVPAGLTARGTHELDTGLAA